MLQQNTSMLGVRYRAYPSYTQQKELCRQMALAKELYNFLLEKNISTYKATKKHSSQFDMQKWITELKQHEPKFKMVHSHVLQNVCKRIHHAFILFFSRLKIKKAGGNVKVGFPRFKKYVRSLTFPDPCSTGAYKFESNKRLSLSKIGKIQIKMHRVPKGNIKTCTIKQERSGKWFVSFSTDAIPETKIQHHDGAIGIDVGCKKLAVLSNGVEIDNPHFYKKAQKRRAFLQRRIFRKKKGSKNRRKAKHHFAIFEERVADQRKDFLEKLSTKLITHHELIVLEDLSINNMVKNHHLAGSILDSSWGAFRDMLQRKASSAGSEVVLINPKDTTQMCSGCHKKQDKKIELSTRVYSCSHCGVLLDRDLNAAYNILRIGTAGRAGIHACRDMPSTFGFKPEARHFVEAGTNQRVLI